MFKMFGCDPIVLGMETMFQPKRRYLGDKNTFIDLEQLHSFHMRVATRLHEVVKRMTSNTLGKILFQKLVMLFCFVTTTRQVSHQTSYLVIVLFKLSMMSIMSLNI